MLDVDIAEKHFTATDGTDLFAIRNLAFQVGKSEFICLIGPSGCGKTTTMRIILGLEPDYTGTVNLGTGKVPRVGVMFQEPRLLPWRSVEQNIRLALPHDERSKDIDALLDVLGLADMRGFYPGELSLGLARRVAMARAFAIEPSLLLLDEPFVSLDEETAQRLRMLLLSVWQQRPTTVLMVTHNLREALELADRIILLTPRPATIRAIIPVPVSRQTRDAKTVAAMVEEISQKFPGLV